MAGGELSGLPPSRLCGTAAQQMRKHLMGLHQGMLIDRYSWWVSWREVADFILPRRYRWLVTPNELNRGAPINQNIIDPTATKASQICASGMMSGITNPSSQWFKLTIQDLDAADQSPVKLWLDECEKRVMRVLSGSNYYTSKATQLHDLVVFGTAPLIIREDDYDVIRCYNTSAGEYFIANGPRNDVTKLLREMTMKTGQIVAEFGEPNVSDAILQAYKNGGAALMTEYKIGHIIEKNDDALAGELVPSKFPWREVYWEMGTAGNKLLRAKGFHEVPFSCPRWDLSGQDAYGRSPGMDAIGCTKQLQLEQRRKAQAIDKMVNPPLKAHVSMKNQPAAMLPGGITYVTDMSSAGSGIAPVYEVQPQLREMLEDIQDVRQLIDKVFLVDLWQMIADSEKDMTAFEVARRQEEKLIQIGPVIERFENEALDPEIDRVFAIMARRGLIPPAPPEIHGLPINVQYVSMLAEAQRAASTGALEQLVAFVGHLMAADPTAIDNIDIDETIDEYADAIGASPRVVRASVQVAQIRAQRQQAQQQQEATQQTAAGVQGAQVLSQTPIGQGSALDALLGTGGNQQQAT